MTEATRQALGGPHSRVHDEKSACASVDRGIGAMGQPDAALRQAREGELLVYGLEASVGPWLVWASWLEHCETLRYHLHEYVGIRDAPWHVADCRSS